VSPDAARIAQLRARMTHYLLHGVGDASEEVVEGNILAEEARKAIDQLAAELDEVRLHYAGWEGRVDDLARERDAAQAEREAIAEALGDAGIPHAHDKGEYTLVARVRMLVDDQAQDAKYRAIYFGELQAAQAELVAMRMAFQEAVEGVGAWGPEADWLRDVFSAAMSGTAGRALAARVPLLEAVEQAARTLVTWKDNLAFGLNKKRVIDALDALDENAKKEGAK
jgi:hypothetical protein